MNNRALPSYVPGDLRETHQVETAREFLEEKLKAAPSPAVSRAGKPSFSSMDAAGIAAIDEINPRSIRENVEYAGAIFQVGMAFGFTVPVRGELKDSSRDVPVPAGSTRVGLYHTHAGPSKDPKSPGGREVYSLSDRGILNHFHLFGYLGTPSNAIRKFVPKPPAPDESPAVWFLGGTVTELRRGSER